MVMVYVVGESAYVIKASKALLVKKVSAFHLKTSTLIYLPSKVKKKKRKENKIEDGICIVNFK